MTVVMARAMTAADHKLMDIDLLAEGVFGGPLPPPERLRAIVGDADRLVAIQADPLPTAPPGARWLRIHPGIGYLLWRGPSPLPRLRLPDGALAGLSQSLAQGLVHAVQQALVSLRRRELAALARSQGDLPSFTRECEVRALLVGRLRTGADWAEAWACWTAIVLLRHQNQINAVRRKLVEVLALATRDIDRVESLSWPFRACIDAIYANYALLPLIEAARQHLVAIAPLLAGPRATAMPETLRRALERSEADLAAPLSLRQAAHGAGISPEHLARLARRHLGMSFLVHRTARRLDAARRRLAESDDTVRSIAAACGFASHEHFQRVFKRSLGISPGAWRRELRARNSNSG